MPFVRPSARTLLTGTCAVLLSAAGCALGIAGSLVTYSHVYELLMRSSYDSEGLALSVLSVVCGLLFVWFGRKLR